MSNNLKFDATDHVLSELRVFTPSQDVIDNANIMTYMKSKGFTSYPEFHKWSVENRFEFWEDMAKELHWFEPWQTTFEWTQKPFFKWFSGGKFNIVYNALDRHMGTPVENKVAYYWEGDDGSSRTVTYKDLYQEVNRLAAGLQKLGVKKGDRVGVYLPAIPEQAIALLAIARLGAVHSVVFAGFAAHALRDRCIDAEAKLIITADGNYRGGKLVELKKIADEAAVEIPTLEKVVVFKRLGLDVTMQEGRDIWWDELIKDVPQDTVVPCEPMDSEDMLYILYTSGSTGKPKGVVHVQAGYGVGVYTTMKFTFDIKPDDVFWCTADVGWVTGHSYLVYGPLMNGATSVYFEGIPTYPAPDRFWSVVEKYK